MNDSGKRPSRPESPQPVRHEGGDPATLKEDPAQFYPTGGAGLDAELTSGPGAPEIPNLDQIEPGKSARGGQPPGRP